MNPTQPSSIAQLPEESPARCQHRTLNGRCRQAATGSGGTLCFYHARAQRQAKDDFTLLEPLVRKTEDFQSAEALNESLGTLHNLLAEGRISPRRASVIAYVDSLILRTLPAMENEGVVIIHDGPRPDREDLEDTLPSQACLPKAGSQ